MKINEFNKHSIFIWKMILITTVFISVIITQTSCSNKEPVSKTDFCLNTTCTITIYDMDKDESSQILKEAFELIRDYENMMSATIEGSDIYKINHAKGSPIEVSEETLEVISLGIDMGDISGGMFDITIGKVTGLWDFTGEDPHVPEDEDIKQALSTVDYKAIRVEGNKVSLDDPEAQIDLGGIAKGYIADRVGEFIENKGAEKALINLGGNVVAIGSKDKDDAWNIGIERPYSDRTEVVGSLGAKNETVVTSGIYERKFEENGVIYHHIIDPKTGYPADSDLESVTLKAKKGNSALCDGFSTICLMYGKEKALEFIASMQEEYGDIGLEAAFIDKNDDIVQTEDMGLKVDGDKKK